MGTYFQERAIRFQASRTARLSFKVISVDETDAMNSIPYQEGSTYPYGGLALYARQPEATRDEKNILLWTVTVDFNSVTNEGDIMSTLTPGEYGVEWASGVEQVPFGIDGDGNYVANAAGVPFDPAPQRPKGIDFLTITQWENPNIDHWDKFLYCTNKNAIEIFTGAGIEQCDADTLYVANIKPLVKWKMRNTTDSAPLIPVAYTLQRDKNGYFQYELNQGDSGWFMGPANPGDGTTGTLQRGNFYAPSGQQMQNVLLHLDGTPFDPNSSSGSGAGKNSLHIKCGYDPLQTDPTKQYYDPAPAPAAFQIHSTRAVAFYGLSGDLTKGTGATQLGWYIRFRRGASVDLSEILNPAFT